MDDPETKPTVERTIAMPMGVVVERRAIDNRWQPFAWRPVSVIPGAPAVDAWKEIAAGDGWCRYHAATLDLELHRKETEGYRYNLSAKVPSIYVGLRHRPGGTHPYVPFIVTASPHEAQSYGEFGDDIVEAVPMPEGVVAWVQAFIDRHHVDRPFKKRKRTKWFADG